MHDMPVTDSAARVAEKGGWAPADLPPGGLALRPFEAWTDSPVMPAVVVAVLYAAGTLLGRTVLGGQEVGQIWFDILNGVIFAYIPAASVILRRGIARDLFELRPTLRCSDEEFARVVASAACVPLRRLVIYCGVSVLVFALMPVYDTGFFGSTPRSLGDPLLQFFMLRQVLLGWVVGYALAAGSGATSTYAFLGRSYVKVDLLDTQSLHPIARQGMRSAFTWILLVSLVSLFWLGPEAGLTNGPIIILVTVWVSAGLLYSVYGVHENIRREKSAQLASLREHIRSEYGAAIGDARSAPDAGAKLAGLIAYHDLIDRAPEWPFDTPMVLRLGLFAALGLGSWLGGAVVERLIDGWF